jgi:hypothetical protein
VAADPHPYYALPRLYGAPAYARPRIVPDSKRPFDPDDLPIAVEQTEDERAFAQMPPSGSHRSNGNGLHPLDSPYGSSVEASGSDGNGLHPAEDPDGSPVEASGSADSTGVHPPGDRHGSSVEASGSDGNGLHPAEVPDGSPVEASGSADSTAVPGVGARRFSLRALTDRMGPRAR